MRRNNRRQAQRLRIMVDSLPHTTQVAMLEGLQRYDIIAGAYSDRDGGVCPMLAAHRCGGRTDFRSFARSWDRFTGAVRARRASERELRTLGSHLEASLWREEGPTMRELAEQVRQERRLRPAPSGPLAEPPPLARLPQAAAPPRSLGRTIITSGITHAGDSLSRQRTTSPTSSGRIICSGGTSPLIQSVMGVSTKPGQIAVHLTPSPASSAPSASDSAITAALVAE